MPRLRKYKVQLVFYEVVVGNLTSHSALKILIFMGHCIVLIGITIKRNPYERIVNTKI